jgi:hypothetical protein
MSVNYQNNGTDLGTTYAKYASTHNGSIAGAITSPTKTATNFKYNGTDLADIFVKYSDLAPNNMKGTKGSACGFTSNAYSGDLGTNLVVKDTIEYLLRVQLNSYDRTTSPVSQAWEILTGSAVFGYVNLVFTTGQATMSNITTSPISISVSKNTHYTYYLTPYTSGGVATSNSNTVDFWTPPTKPTIGGSSTALANSSGSAVSFTFAGTYDYVYVYTSDGNRINDTQYTTSGFSLPITAVKTTTFYIVPYDHGTNTVNTAFQSDSFTFTVSDGTASLGTTTDITSSGFTINITGTGIASVTGTSTNDGGKTNVTGTVSVSNAKSATVAFSSLSANTDYSVSVTVTFLSNNTKTLSTTVKTQSNIVVGTPSATSTYYSITVTINATNTTGVTDKDLNKYTQTPNTNDWSYTYGAINSQLTSDNEYTYTLIIAGYTGNAPVISYYTRPFLSIIQNSISRTSASVGNVNLTISGRFTKYKIFWNTDNNFDTQNDVVTDLTTKYSQDYTITIPSTVSSSSMVYNLFVVSWNNNSKEYFTKSDYYYSQFNNTIPAYDSLKVTTSSKFSIDDDDKGYYATINWSYTGYTNIYYNISRSVYNTSTFITGNINDKSVKIYCNTLSYGDLIGYHYYVSYYATNSSTNSKTQTQTDTIDVPWQDDFGGSVFVDKNTVISGATVTFTIQYVNTDTVGYRINSDFYNGRGTYTAYVSPFTISKYWQIYNVDTQQPSPGTVNEVWVWPDGSSWNSKKIKFWP